MLLCAAERNNEERRLIFRQVGSRDCFPDLLRLGACFGKAIKAFPAVLRVSLKLHWRWDEESIFSLTSFITRTNFWPCRPQKSREGLNYCGLQLVLTKVISANSRVTLADFKQLYRSRYGGVQTALALVRRTLSCFLRIRNEQLDNAPHSHNHKKAGLLSFQRTVRACNGIKT
jgi:hypothetical protein